MTRTSNLSGATSCTRDISPAQRTRAFSGRLILEITGNAPLNDLGSIPENLQITTPDHMSLLG